MNTLPYWVGIHADLSLCWLHVQVFIVGFAEHGLISNQPR